MRLERFVRSRDPRALWPELAESSLAAARRAIESTVRDVLAGRTPATLVHGGDAGVYAMKIAAYATGTGALLGRWIEDGRLHDAAAVRSVLARELDQGRRRAARIEREVLPALDALLATGITPVVMKGFHTARVYHEEPGVRPAADVDLLVPPDRTGDAETALRAAGFEPTTARTKGPYKRHWMSVSIDRRVFSVEGIDERNRWEIDLHDSFDRQVGGIALRLDAGVHHVEPFTVAGRAVLAPKQPLLMLVLACQLSADLKSMRLMRLVDLVKVIRTDCANGQLDWDEALAHMRRTVSARLAYPALALTEKLVAGTIEPRVLLEVQASTSWAIRRAVSRMVPSADSTDKTNLMVQFMWARGPWDLARILRHSISRGDGLSLRGLFATFRMLARRLLKGNLTLGRPDETST